MRATTILAVRHNGQLAVAGDGQVTLGESIVKAMANKIGVDKVQFDVTNNEQVTCVLRTRIDGKLTPLDGASKTFQCHRTTGLDGSDDLAPEPKPDTQKPDEPGKPGKVVIDLFWNPICQTSGIEAQRVREIAAEFGDSIVLNEYRADDRDVLLKYQTPRAILVDGNEIYWGYEAPREGIREAIAKALDASSP